MRAVRNGLVLRQFLLQTFDSDTRPVTHVPPDGHQRAPRAENALDALLDELQTFTKPGDQKKDSATLGPPRRLHSHQSADSPVRTPSHGYAPAISLPKPSTGGGKLQVSEASLRKSLSLSPSASPIPDGKGDLFSRAPVGGPKHAAVDGQDAVQTSVSPQPPLSKKVPPPPPPRTTSRSPLTSPTASASPATTNRPNRDSPAYGHIRSNSEPVPNGCSEVALRRVIPGRSSSKEEPEPEIVRTTAISDDNLRRDQLSSNSSSSESVNSQEGLQMALQQAKLERKSSTGNGNSNPADVEGSKKSTPPARSRQELLEQRHQELLRKQKQLQEQYARLQQLQRGNRFSPPRASTLGDLKKTGSESNILSKTLLSLTPASGSLTHLAIGMHTPKSPTSHNAVTTPNAVVDNNLGKNQQAPNKIFETDIL